MTARAALAVAAPAMTRLLAIALVVVTVLPIAVFATDLTNRPVFTGLRERAGQRVNTRRVPEAPEARREQLRVRRARARPTVARVVGSMVLQFAVLLAIAVAGRWLFALRL